MVKGITKIIFNRVAINTFSNRLLRHNRQNTIVMCVSFFLSYFYLLSWCGPVKRLKKKTEYFYSPVSSLLAEQWQTSDMCFFPDSHDFYSMGPCSLWRLIDISTYYQKKKKNLILRCIWTCLVFTFSVRKMRPLLADTMSNIFILLLLILSHIYL